MATILVLEDDKDLNKSLCTFLAMKNHETDGFTNAEAALEGMENKKYDLIISDVMMKDMDGFEFAEAIRDMDDSIPIMFMTALYDIYSKTKGYKIGIDDYMVKPVDPEELNLRIGALLKRSGLKDEKKLTIGDFILDREEFSAYWKGEEISLTKREFEILFTLLSSPKKTFTRSLLLDKLWDWDSNSSPRAIDVYITKLRTKLEKCTSFEIITVHGLGYKAIIK